MPPLSLCPSLYLLPDGQVKEAAPLAALARKGLAAVGETAGKWLGRAGRGAETFSSTMGPVAGADSVGLGAKATTMPWGSASRAATPGAPWASTFAGGTKAVAPNAATGAGGLWGAAKNFMGKAVVPAAVAGTAGTAGYGWGSYNGQINGAVRGSTEALQGVQDQITQHPWQTMGLGLSSLFGNGAQSFQGGLQAKLKAPGMNPLSHDVLQQALLNLMRRNNQDPLV